ncbi:hypothetical protein BHE74_00051380 [Ensete ventricosum]|nr:hypothetical protein BHE74_00051380 [Ensete ventricosum]
MDLQMKWRRSIRCVLTDKTSSLKTVALWVFASVTFGVCLGFKDGVEKASEFFAGQNDRILSLLCLMCMVLIIYIYIYIYILWCVYTIYFFFFWSQLVLIRTLPSHIIVDDEC